MTDVSIAAPFPASGSDSESLRELVNARAAGDPARCRRAEEAVVVEHLRVAAALARRYRRRGVSDDDLEQVARLGLVKAARRWQPELGRFLAFAKPTIDGELKRHFRDSATTIRIPRMLYETQPRVAAAARALRQEMSREPTVAEIAARAGIPGHQVRQIQAASGNCQPLPDDGLDGTDGLSSAEADAELSQVTIRATLRPALATISDKQRQVIALRFVWGQSQREIAAAMGVNQMQVSRLLRSALAALRDRLGPSAEQSP